MTGPKNLMASLNHCMMYLQVVTTIKNAFRKSFGGKQGRKGTPDHQLHPSVMRTGM